MKIHWHFENPWRDRAIYVPLDELMPAKADSYRTAYGEKLDAYILVQPTGSFQLGIRYGKGPDQYLSPQPSIPHDDLVQLVEQNRLQWRPCRWEDEKSRPTLEGNYVFRISGDSETDGPHVYYDFPDYTANGKVFTDDGEVFAYGDTDEEPESIIAWYGPLTAPPCDCF